MGHGVIRTASIKVVDESGQRLVVDEYTDMLDDGTMSFPGAELVGLREYRLGDDACNRLKDGTFVVVRTGQRLRRV
ncbi:MAG TPA: hypothetical protein VFU71_09150 [Burkholderiaceae bacterium]|nr:hypothetical protein [Burkholderiaceae bacterium]